MILEASQRTLDPRLNWNVYAEWCALPGVWTNYTTGKTLDEVLASYRTHHHSPLHSRLVVCLGQPDDAGMERLAMDASGYTSKTD